MNGNGNAIAIVGDMLNTYAPGPASNLSDIEAMRRAASEQLDVQTSRAAHYQRYYDGEAYVPALINTDERRAFRRFLDESWANWCELIVNAVAERLQVTGFRFAGADDAAWQIWQDNQMDADSELVQTDALVTGHGFVLVQPDDSTATGVSITPESPFEATVLYEPGYRRKRIAGYKRYDEGTGRYTEVLILPDVIATWSPGTPGNPLIEPNPAGDVGMIAIVPQPRTHGPARSELTPAVAVQDRINTTIFNRMVATDYGAFRQIWATGVKIARETVQCEDGEEVTRTIRPFDIGANRLLANENPNGRFGSFPESTLAGYLASVEQDVTQMAAITQTPPYYLAGSMINLSADAIKAAEAGLVAKVRRRALHIGEAWEDVMRYALALTGSPGAADVSAEVIWRDFETRSEAQLVDALVKMRTLNVPTRVLWQRWGATPQEITQWESMNAQEQSTIAANAAVALGAPEGAYARMMAAAAQTTTPPAQPPPTTP